MPKQNSQLYKYKDTRIVADRKAKRNAAKERSSYLEQKEQELKNQLKEAEQKKKRPVWPKGVLHPATRCETSSREEELQAEIAKLRDKLTKLMEHRAIAL